MCMIKKVTAIVGVLTIAAVPVQALTVSDVTPGRHALTAPVGTTISVTFDRPVKPASVIAGTTFWAFGRWSGTVTGTVELLDGDRTIRLIPNRPLSAGESLIVILSHDIEATDGSTLRPGGYSWQFRTRTARTALEYEEVQRLNVRTDPAVRVRAYGGFASDLDGDRFLDLTIVNEDSADLRTLLNRGDGSGTFEPFLVPTTPVGNRASPSEPSDFNRDGAVDVCVVNIDDATVSILLGNGDGSFAPQQLVPVGFAPRGVAVLDADGDGDTDIVNTNSGAGGSLSILLNDGDGVFGAPTFFEGGGAQEWSLAAADMNDDGWLDLVCGSQSDGLMLVHLANGDGTFTLASSQSAGGDTWMINCGDVDGNGTEDVATANSRTNRGAILLGDGAGGLGPPTDYVTDPFPLATDLGDLDGDGDLDWVTSSFAGDWYYFENDGSGAFEFREAFPAPEAASCSLVLDVDNDLDLDIALIDELSDDVIIMHNVGAVIPVSSTWSLFVLALALSIAASLVIMPTRTTPNR